MAANFLPDVADLFYKADFTTKNDDATAVVTAIKTELDKYGEVDMFMD